MKITRKYFLWVAWAVTVSSLTVYLGLAMTGKNEEVFLPGETTHGHYQIELACSACHTDNFEGVKQDACLSCHKEELDIANDSHPAKKFLDPRNADRVEILDARMCITCHREHQPEITEDMGVTLPMDYCFHCHEDIADDRPSHEGMPFDSCATAGCHNYHDNRALYEDFMIKHLDEPAFLEMARVPQSNQYKTDLAADDLIERILKTKDIDAPTQAQGQLSINHDWVTTAHAQAGINCTDCHNVEDPETRVIEWTDKPDHTSCQKCHEEEAKGFLAGKHGMRLAQDMSPMTPSMARLTEFKAQAAHKELNCITCHGAHKFDTRHAAVDACLSCHNDEHSRNYLGSKHYSLWLNEVNGTADAGSGVSCATCHLPKVTVTKFGQETTIVQHNQNDTLKPNEKMIRPACLNCHGLGYSIDALADPELIKNNFQGQPSTHIESLDLVKKRLETLGK